MTPAELAWLGAIARQVDSCAEVGCWKGRTTQRLLDSCAGPVYAVDHWRGSEAEREGPHKEATERDIFADFMRNVGDRPNLMVRRGNSVEVAQRLPLVDFVFVDAGHTYEEVKADIEAWTPKTLRMIAGHDYHLEGVRRAVTEAFGEHVKTAADSIWYVEHPVARNVMIGTPCYGGMATVRYLYSILRLQPFLQGKGVGMVPKFVEGDSLVPRARISLFGQFLSDPDLTHLLFIDADLRWEPQSVLDLVRWDKPVACGVYPKKSYPTDDRRVLGWPMNFLPGTHADLPFDPETRCFEIQDAPTGFLMIRRDAAEQMVAAYPETRCMIGEGGWDAECNQNTYNLFDCPIDTDGMYLSEDFGFCRRWQRIGGKVWMDPHIVLGHTGPHEFRGKIFDSLQRTDEVLIKEKQYGSI